MPTSSWRMSWRMRVASRMPVVLLEAQFEVLMAVFCLVIGPAAALHIVEPQSIGALFPDVFIRGYGVVLTFAGAAIAAGLRHGVPRWPVPSGLNLLGSAVGVYALAILAVAGTSRVAVALLFIAVALLCWLRSFTISTSLRERAAVAVAVRAAE